jgi:dTDP-D-glucose 4,6-dehydratase
MRRRRSSPSAWRKSTCRSAGRIAPYALVLPTIAANGEPIVNLDKLIYAGNPRNREPLRNDKRHSFVQRDICDRPLLRNVLDTLMRGRTTIVIARRLSTIERADRIVVLDSAGRAPA